MQKLTFKNVNELKRFVKKFVDEAVSEQLIEVQNEVVQAIFNVLPIYLYDVYGFGKRKQQQLMDVLIPELLLVIKGEIPLEDYEEQCKKHGFIYDINAIANVQYAKEINKENGK